MRIRAPVNLRAFPVWRESGDLEAARRGLLVEPVAIVHLAKKRRLTHFGSIWYLIRSDFNQRAKLPKRRSSLLPVHPSRGSVMHEDLRASRRVRLLFDHLVEQLGAFVER